MRFADCVDELAAVLPWPLLRRKARDAALAYDEKDETGVTRPATPGTIVPRDLGMLGQATSDSGYLVLEAIAAVQGPRVAADAASGYADAFARFAIQHPDAFD